VAASLVGEVESVTEATGSSVVPYAMLALAALRGRAAEARFTTRRGPAVRDVRRLLRKEVAGFVIGLTHTQTE
jgi:hypothetical protein